MQLRHAVGGGAIVAHHYHRIQIELAGLVGRLHRMLGGEDLGRCLDHAIFRGHGRDLDHGAAQIARQQLGAACGLEYRACGREHARIATLADRLPHQLAIHQQGAAEVILHLAEGRGGVHVDQPLLRQPAHQAGHGTGLLEGVHIGRAVRVHAHQQRHHVGEIAQVIPGQLQAGGAGQRHHVDAVVGAAAGGEQGHQAVDQGALVQHLAQGTIGR
ncbi:hypothetical protein D3C84_653950 [compost metagenome]